MLVRSTVRAATSCATGVFPVAVTDLTEGVLKMMVWEKLKLIAAGAFVAAGLTAGALAQQAPKDRPPESPPPKAEAPPSEKPNGRALGDPRWIGVVSSGATLEVVGISPHPSGPDTWWRPDRAPLRQPPCDQSDTRITSGGDVVYRAVVVRLNGVPPGAEHKWWINEANGGSQGRAKLDGKPVPGLSEIVTEFPSGMKTCTVRFEVAAGPWQTVKTWGKEPGALGSRIGPSYIFGGAIATKEGTTLSVTHDIQDVSVRLVAVDLDGKEHPAARTSWSGVKEFHQLVGEFDLPPERIKEFQVQTRPYERVEVPGVPLKPEGLNK
jgi:hypothetical protein